MDFEKLLGIGLRHPHYWQVLEEKPNIGWLEVHTENFMLEGGPLLELLSAIRQHYPLSFHGVGLSLGSAQGVRLAHLKRIKRLLQQFEPFLVSDHLSWSTSGRTFLPDLLPIPYTEESLKIFTENVDKAQNFLQRTILIENPSSYVEYCDSALTEIEFLNTLAKNTGAKILLDVNNIYVSCCNHGWDVAAYIRGISPELVGEVHLAGHSQKIINHNILRIDTHNDFVCKEVWDLYAKIMQRLAAKPTLLEWDADIPSLQTLIQESRQALVYMQSADDKQNVCA